MTALRALDRHLDALPDAGRLRRCDRREPFILRLLARLATLGFVLQPLVMKEGLLAGSPDKMLVTINAENRAIRMFYFRAR